MIVGVGRESVERSLDAVASALGVRLASSGLAPVPPTASRRPLRRQASARLAMRTVVAGAAAGGHMAGPGGEAGGGSACGRAPEGDTAEWLWWGRGATQCGEVAGAGEGQTAGSRHRTGRGFAWLVVKQRGPRGEGCRTGWSWPSCEASTSGRGAAHVPEGWVAPGRGAGTGRTGRGCTLEPSDCRVGIGPARPC